MLNILIADDDIFYSKVLMDSINSKDIKVCNLVINGEEALNILKSKSDIDIVLLDLGLPKYNGLEILEILLQENRIKYEKSVIVISGNSELSLKLQKNILIYAILTKPMSFFEIKSKVDELVNYKKKQKSIIENRKKIIAEIKYLGYNLTYKGTKYLIDIIEFLVLNQNKNITNLKKEIYPIIAKRNKTTIYNIKSNITKATEQMYMDCDAKKLNNYFKYEREQRPTVKTAIYTILNHIISL